MPKSNRDEFSAKTKRDLAARAGHVCSFPECGQPTSGPSAEGRDASVNVGEACHISAAASGPGARRYDPSMTSEERSSIENGIWMCRTHAKLIDSDEATYTVEQLQQWKREAEERAEQRLRSGTAQLDHAVQAMRFVLEWIEEELEVTGPDDRTRTVTPPWITYGARFAVARLGFQKLSRQAVESDEEHAELLRCATVYGEMLFALLFDDAGAEDLRSAIRTPGHARPLVTIASEDDVLLSLPWELISHEGSFLVRDGKIDLTRTIPGAAGPGPLVPESDVFKLVVNVSVPEGSGLDYEGESYRITRSLSESCELTPTELGTVEDLIETAGRVRPTGIHFSGHGSPGRLQFEDDEGREHVLPVAELAAKLKRRVPGGLPPPWPRQAGAAGRR